MQSTTTTETVFNVTMELEPDSNELHRLLENAIDDMRGAAETLERELRTHLRHADRGLDHLASGYQLNELGLLPDQNRVIAYTNQYEIHAKYVRKIARVAGFDL